MRNLLKTLLSLLTLLVWTCCGNLLAQTIEWEKDGSVKVTGGGHTFLTPITAKAPLIAEFEMMLIDQSYYNEKPRKETDDNGIYSMNLSTGGFSRLEIFTRRSPTGNPNGGDPWYNYDITDNNYMIYGCEATGNRTGFTWKEDSWKAYGFYNSPAAALLKWNFLKTEIQSTDFRNLWNRPTTEETWEKHKLAMVGMGLFLETGIFLAIDRYYIRGIGRTAARSLIKRWTLRTGVALTLLLTNQFLLHQQLYENNTVVNRASVNFIAQVPTAEGMELAIPDKIANPANKDERQINRLIDKLNKSPQKFNCTSAVNAGKQCIKSSFRDVLVKMRVENEQVKAVKLPGIVVDQLSPYQLFKNYNYVFEEETDIHVLKNGLETVGSTTFFDTIEQELPQNIVKPIANASIDVDLSISNYKYGSGYFYIVSDTEAIGLPAEFIRDMGTFGVKGTTTYNLYRYHVVHPTDETLAAELTVTLDANTFLAGDNIIWTTPQKRDNVVVNNSNLDAGFRRSGRGGQFEDAELTVNGNVLVSNVSRFDEINEYNDFTLFVGNDGSARGLLSKDIAILDSDNWFFPDYVFEPDYTTLSLDSLQSFVKKYQHLPYVVGQSAVDLAGFYSTKDMMMGQLRHLEELYLHTFRQNKQLYQQDMKLEGLKKRLKNIQTTLDKRD